MVGRGTKICICDKFGIVVDNNVVVLVGTSVREIVEMVFGNIVWSVVSDKVDTVLGINEVRVLVCDNIGTFVGIKVGMLVGRNAR